MGAFSNWTPAMVEEHQRKVAAGRNGVNAQPAYESVHKPILGSKPVALESDLHEAIIQWCDSQYPKWKYIHARMDKKSTIDKGAPDFTIFGTYPICIVVECKAKNGKPTMEQLGWHKEMEMLGWTVRIVRSMDEFTSIINAASFAG